MKPDYSGYHDCPCRDCFDVAIGGRIRTIEERNRLADQLQDPDTGRFLGRYATADDIQMEDRGAPALCILCDEAGCDHTGQSDCQRQDAYYGGDHDE